MGSSHISGKRDLSLLTCRQMDGNNRMVTEWCDDLTLIPHTIHGIAHSALSIVKVQPALITCIVRMSGHRDIEIAEGLVRHAHILSSGIGHHLGIRQVLCFLVLSLKDQLAYLWQCLLGLGIDDIVRLSCPDGLLIQLDMLHGRCAKDHPTYHTITNR